MKPKGEIVVYKSGKDVTLEVKLEDESVWLTQKQMSGLFDKNLRTISEHIKNVYNEGELEEKATIRNFRIVQKEKQREVEREIKCYNLYVIISVFYRVKSQLVST